MPGSNKRRAEGEQDGKIGGHDGEHAGSSMQEKDLEHSLAGGKAREKIEEQRE